NGESLRLWAEAMSRLRVRDAVGAISRLQKARQTDPENPFVDDALAVAWSRLGFDSRAAEAAGRALSRAEGLPEEIRWVLTARAHEMRFEMAEAANLYEKLWNRWSDNLDYGLSLAAAQRQSGAPEVSFATVAALRKLAAPDGQDPRIDLAESDAAWGVGDFPRCRDAAERAIDKAEARRATLLAASGRIARGWALIRLGRLDAARADLRAAGGIYRRVGDRGAAASARAAEALIDQSQGRVVAARQIYEEAIRVFHEVGDRTREAKILNNLAALIGEGDLATASRLLSRSLAIKREIGDQQGIALTLANLASVRQTQGDTKGARPYLEEALRISRRLGDAHGTAQVLRGIAAVEMKERHFDRARTNLEEALGLSRQNGDAEGQARAELGWGRLEAASGRNSEAGRHFELALESFRRIGDKSQMAEAQAALAKLSGDPGR
ncbi:MAG TPA: tetratricopeptide repeat protein, partial [Thermoanaerobaculia bacterium]|nr:tetratricopeptide repeat protein [Thermoanaerobaculia bacterium]